MLKEKNKNGIQRNATVHAHIQEQLINFKSLVVGILLLILNAQNLYAVEGIGKPEISLYDSNGVNLLSGQVGVNVNDLSIGNGDLSLQNSIAYYRGQISKYYFASRFYSGLIAGPTEASVFIDHQESKFGSTDNGETYYAAVTTGIYLIKNSDSSFTFIKRDGTTVLFEFLPNVHRKITRPNGLVTNIYYKSASFNGVINTRIQSVTQNNGLQLKFNYLKNYTSTSLSEDNDWIHPISGVAINNSVEYCSPTADTCSLVNDWPTASYQWSNGDNTLSITEPSGHKTTINMGSAGSNFIKIVNITKDSSSPSNFFYAVPQPCPWGGECVGGYSNVIVKSTKGDAEWFYTYQQAGEIYYESQRSGPDGLLTAMTNIRADLAPIQKVTYNASLYTYNENHINNHVDQFYDAEHGGYTNYVSYDSRENVTQSRKENTGMTDLIRTADYDLSCNNYLTCNKPNYLIDAKGNRTDYTYHSQSGQIATETKPADAHGIRSQTRYTYEQKYAWAKNSSGSYVQSTSPIWLLTKTSLCIKGAASGSGCALTNDEVVTTYEYGLNSGPNNLFLKEIVVTTGGQSRRTCYGYDNYGNKLSETSPKANLSACQ